MAVSHASGHAEHARTTLELTDEPARGELVQLGRTHRSNSLVLAWHRFYAVVLKRTIDLAAASIVLLFLSLALVMVAIAIRLDSPGPILYRQKRVGKDGRIFTIYKFRTMTHDTGSTVRYFLTGEGTVCHKIRNDPRMTRVGRHLRRLSIDELPQLLNILRGDMSLIGPRPELVDIVRTYQPWQHRRHELRPGLTGWWQISGRGDRPMHEHTELDLYYVDNFSPGLDLKILLRTVAVVLKGRGAF